MEPKPGIMTTEFWMTMISQIAGIILLVWGASKGAEGGEFMVAVGTGLMAVTGGSYSISRAISKKNDVPTEIVKVVEGDVGHAGGQTTTTTIGKVGAVVLAAAATLFLFAGCESRAMIDAHAIEAPMQGVLSRHDQYVTDDPSLADVERTTFLRSSAIVREVIEEATPASP